MLEVPFFIIFRWSFAGKLWHSPFCLMASLMWCKVIPRFCVKFWSCLLRCGLKIGKPWLEIETVSYAILKKYGLQIKTVNGEKFIDGWFGRKYL